MEKQNKCPFLTGFKKKFTGALLGNHLYIN
jgi:hypothetical protein